MKEFVSRGLHEVYKTEISEWFIYLDQQEFGRKLQNHMLAEVERFIEGRTTVEELMDRVFKKPEWEIEFIEEIPVNYVFKSALGYAA